MTINENSAAMDAFKKLCDEMEDSPLVSTEECQYWVFERGYRAAMQQFIDIMENGAPPKQFGSPKLQAIAEKLAR
jgi:hypothetical protein